MTCRVKFRSDPQTFSVKFMSERVTSDVKFDSSVKVENIVDGDPYEGDYFIAPKFIEQTLPTKDKLMKDDVTVRGIAIHSIGNAAGGETVYIASEVF